MSETKGLQSLKNSLIDTPPDFSALPLVGVSIEVGVVVLSKGDLSIFNFQLKLVYLHEL